MAAPTAQSDTRSETGSSAPAIVTPGAGDSPRGWSQLEVLSARPDPPSATVTGTWPCRGCRRDRPLLGAWRATVRDPSRLDRTRAVRLCAACVRDLVAADVLDLTAFPAVGDDPFTPGRHRAVAGRE